MLYIVGELAIASSARLVSYRIRSVKTILWCCKWFPFSYMRTCLCYCYLLFYFYRKSNELLTFLISISAKCWIVNKFQLLNYWSYSSECLRSILPNMYHTKKKSKFIINIKLLIDYSLRYLILAPILYQNKRNNVTAIIWVPQWLCFNSLSQRT